MCYITPPVSRLPNGDKLNGLHNPYHLSVPSGKESKGKFLHCVGTAWAPRTQRLGYAPKLYGWW